MADQVSLLTFYFSLASPLVLIFSVVITLFGAHEWSKEELIGSLSLAIMCAAGVGFFGAHVIEPIKPGGWNWQYFYYPFLLSKWLTIGFCVFWPIFICLFTKKLKALLGAPVFHIIIAIPLIALTILDNTFVPKVTIDDKKFWNEIFYEVNTSLPFEEYEKHLSREGQRIIRHQLSYKKEKLNPEMLWILYRLGYDVSDHPNIDRKLAETIYNAPKRSELGRLARNPGIPIDLMEKLSERHGGESVALNPAVPLDILEKLISNVNAKIDEEKKKKGPSENTIRNFKKIINSAEVSLGKHPDTPVNRLIELSNSTNEEVSESVLWNVNLPTAMLEENAKKNTNKKGFTNDPAFIALRTLSLSPFTPPSRLLDLSKHKLSKIRSAVARNPSTPNDVLNKLCADEYSVRGEALNNLSMKSPLPDKELQECYSKFDRRNREGLDNEHEITIWLYKQLKKEGIHAYDPIKQIVNLSTAEYEELKEIFSGFSTKYKIELTKIYSLPVQYLEVLAQDTDSNVAERAKKRLDESEHNQSMQPDA